MGELGKDWLKGGPGGWAEDYRAKVDDHDDIRVVMPFPNLMSPVVARSAAWG
jgi:hypothetical protein